MNLSTSHPGFSWFSRRSFLTSWSFRSCTNMSSCFHMLWRNPIGSCHSSLAQTPAPLTLMASHASRMKSQSLPYMNAGEPFQWAPCCFSVISYCPLSASLSLLQPFWFWLLHCPKLTSGPLPFLDLEYSFPWIATCLAHYFSPFRLRAKCQRGLPGPLFMKIATLFTLILLPCHSGFYIRSEMTYLLLFPLSVFSCMKTQSPRGQWSWVETMTCLIVSFTPRTFEMNESPLILPSTPHTLVGPERWQPPTCQAVSHPCT